MYAAGRTTGLVVDCGEHLTEFLPVYEGFSTSASLVVTHPDIVPPIHIRTRSGLGCRYSSDRRRGGDRLPVAVVWRNNLSFSTTAEREIVRGTLTLQLFWKHTTKCTMIIDIKEKLAFCSTNVERDTKIAAMQETRGLASLCIARI